MGDYIIGGIIGFLIGLQTLSWAYDNGLGEKKMICEKDLPRSEKCVFIAIPEKEIKGLTK